MATFKYPYTVKVNGEIIPPNTEVEITDETTKAETTKAETAKEETVDNTAEESVKSRAKKKA